MTGNMQRRNWRYAAPHLGHRSTYFLVENSCILFNTWAWTMNIFIFRMNLYLYTKGTSKNKPWSIKLICCVRKRSAIDYPLSNWDISEMDPIKRLQINGYACCYNDQVSKVVSLKNEGVHAGKTAIERINKSTDSSIWKTVNTQKGLCTHEDFLGGAIIIVRGQKIEIFQPKIRSSVLCRLLNCRRIRSCLYPKRVKRNIIIQKLHTPWTKGIRNLNSYILKTVLFEPEMLKRLVWSFSAFNFFKWF